MSHGSATAASRAHPSGRWTEPRSSPRFPDWVKRVRRERQLHQTVEQRLIELVAVACPDFHPVKEPVGLAGGRNDLMLFEYSARKVVFEIFATRSQVSRDLRILDKTSANMKIAVIIDQDIDKGVLSDFLRQNPAENYPFVFIGELFASDTSEVVLKLRELILGDDLARIRRLLSRWPRKVALSEWCRKERLPVLQMNDVASGNVTFAKVFNFLVLTKCMAIGVKRQKLEAFAKWFCRQQMSEYVLLRVGMGLSMFLYTDFADNMAVYADTDLVDWLRVGPEVGGLYGLLSLNSVVREIEDRFLKSQSVRFPRELRMTVGESQWHLTDDGNMVTVSPPKNTKQIVILPSRDWNVRSSKDARRVERAYRAMIRVAVPGAVISIPPGATK